MTHAPLDGAPVPGPGPGQVPAVELVGVTKRFGEVIANDDVDLAVLPGEFHAVVGENGAGKSTAMSVLFGVHRPDAGGIRRHGRPVRFRSPQDAIDAGFGMVHQQFRLFPSLTVAENVVIGAEPRHRSGSIDQAAAADRVVDLGERFGLPVDPRAVLADLPVGLRQRVEILKALHREADVLILDEPTAVLTPAESASLFSVLHTITAQGSSVVLVTHKLGEVMAASETVTVMRGGRVVGRHRTVDTTADALVREMIGRSLRVAPTSSRPRAHTGSRIVLDLQDVGVRDSAGLHRLAGVSLRVEAGEMLGIAGVAGSGQRELVDSVVGLRSDASGTIRLNGIDVSRAPVHKRRELGIGYIPEDRQGRGTAAGLSVAENLLMGSESDPTVLRRWGRLSRVAVRQRARRLVEQFSVRAASVTSPMSSLSGGNAQKSVLARELSRDVSLVIAEEPTQGVDVGAQEYIHALLRSARDDERAVLVLSSDLGELRALCDRIVVMFGGRVVAELATPDATDEALGAAMTGTIPIGGLA